MFIKYLPSWAMGDSYDAWRGSFSVDGYVNQQNCCHWAEANPVWCGVYKLGLTVPCYFEYERGQAVTDNSER